jgi:hypothetical protein
MTGFHVRKHHTGEDVLAARSFIAPFVKPLPRERCVSRAKCTGSRQPPHVFLISATLAPLCEGGEKTSLSDYSFSKLILRNFQFRNKSHWTVVRAITSVPITPRIPLKGLGEICSVATGAEAAVRVALINDASIQASG